MDIMSGSLFQWRVIVQFIEFFIWLIILAAGCAVEGTSTYKPSIENIDVGSISSKQKLFNSQ